MHMSILGLANHDSLHWTRKDSADSSRHVTDYESLQAIGRGGFGVVWKVKNRVDGHVYAMKRVSDFSKSILREVEVLSSIHHENVVRYYGAWVEKGDELNEDDETASSLDDPWTPTSQTSLEENVEDPVCQICGSSYRDWEVSFEHWGLLDSVLQPLNLCIDCYLKSIPKSDVSDISIREKKVLKEYLFIIMEYCDGTLQEAVQESTDEEKWNFFEQCLRGLDYLHSTGFIHRDVKPTNIFLRNGIVKIGDLGLATAAVTKQQSPNSSPKQQSKSKSSQVGTFLYTAPEVETGQYNEKCDVYSLGVVLVELFSSFGTAMERAETLDNLRRGKLPDDFISSYPTQAALALRMVATNPSERPSCKEILSEITPHPPKSIQQLETELHEKEDTITRLRQLLDSHDISHDHI